MTISEYLDTVDLTLLSKKLDVSVSTLYSWKSLTQSPKPEMAVKLIVTSCGQLDLYSIYLPYLAKKDPSIREYFFEFFLGDEPMESNQIEMDL